MSTIVTTLHIIAGLFLILVVLLQTGKGAAMGSAFGSGASQTMFGSSGAGSFLTKLTTAAAVVFMVTSLTLATMSSDKTRDSVIQDIDEPAQQSPIPSSDTPEKETDKN
jgi:preprotein translocase subunit SecG